MLKLNEQQVDNQLVQQYQTVQNYVTTLFNSLPKIQLLNTKNNKGIDLIKKLIQQNQLYGRKIIQLSQKFTAIYRKDHIFDRRDVQDKIKQIYLIVLDNQNIIQKQKSIDQMLFYILNKIKSDSFNMIKAGYQQIQQSQIKQLQQSNTRQLQQSHARHLQIDNVSKMIQSKIQMKNISLNSIKDSKFIPPNQNLYLHNLNPNGGIIQQSVQVSRKQSVQSKTHKTNAKSTKKKQKNILQEQDVPLKKILKIKNFLQEQQNTIKQIFQKINKKIDEFKISKTNISQQKFTYTKIEDETNLQNVEALLQASFKNHKINLLNVTQLLQIIFFDFDKKIKDQMQSQNKFNLYTKEIQKREQVYSYAVSKLIEQVNNLQNNFQKKNYYSCQEIVNNLLSISTKFYELYPSNSIIKDLRVKAQKKEFQMIQKKNYGLQVNISKGQRSLTKNILQNSTVRKSSQHQLQMFKLQTKITQIFEKFQKNNLKFKKSIQTKQIYQLINNIKQAFPQKNKSLANSAVNNNLNSQMIKFQEEYKKIISQYDSKQQKLIEQYTKRQKKIQKRIKQLQQCNEDMSQNHIKQTNQHKEQIKKITKKLQNTQQKIKIADRKIQEYQKVIKTIKIQLQEIKKKKREQQLQTHHKLQQILRKNQTLTRQIQQKQARIQVLSASQHQKQTKSNQQITLYKKKIILIQDHNSKLQTQKRQLTYKLQNISQSSYILSSQLNQMKIIYEQKIKQLDQTIQMIKQMKNQICHKEQKIIYLQLEMQKVNKINEEISEQHLKYKQTIAMLKEQVQKIRRQKEKYKEIGQLNEEDINKLKEQMTKVHTAYQQAEEQLESLRLLYEDLEQNYNKLEQQNQNIKRFLEDAKRQNQKNLFNQKHLKQITQKYDITANQNLQIISKYKTLQSQIYLLKKQNKKYKQQELQSSKQIRQLRQQLQRHKQQQSLLKGKYKIQLETLKIQLRKKNQEFIRMKQNYQEKIEILEGKYKQLQKFVSQKELLAKISNNHSTQ